MPKDRPIFSLALAQMIIWAGLYYIFPALLVRWEQALGWAKTDLTLAITIAVLFSAIASPFIGKLIDHGHGPVVMTASTLLGGISLLYLSTVTLLWQFYILWSVIGLCFAGCLYEPSFALVTRAQGKHAKQSIITITLIAGFASSISFPMTHVLTELYGWRVAIQFFALTVILLGTPLIWYGTKQIEISKARLQTPKTQNYDQPHAFLKKPTFWYLAIGFSLLGILHGTTLHHLLPILYDRGITPNIAIIAAAFIGPMQVAGRLIMLAAGNNISNHNIAISCFIIMAISILLLISAGTTPMLLVGFVLLFGGGYGMVSIIRPLITHDVLGANNFGAKSGALATLYLIGTASSPYLGAIIWAIGGYNLVLPLLVLLAACGLGLYLLSYRPSKVS